MASHTIVFCFGGSADPSRVRWVDPVRELWPGPDRPDVLTFPLSTVIEKLENGTPDFNAGAFLVIFGPDEKPATIDRAVESLHARNLPALCLLRDADAWKRFQRQGVMFEGYDISPAIIAAMLFTLAERQSAVEILAKEVYVAQRCQGGIRMEMDRLHEELHMAAAVQREFLPASLPRVSGLDIGVVFRPVNYVSGDIYNVEQLDETHVGFFIADAVGHGVPAALLTMILSHSLATTEITSSGRRVIEPADVLRRLNARLCDHSRPGTGRFATAVYGVIDTARGTVTLAGAGHPPPMLVGPGGARMIETDGPLLGIFPDGEFSQAQVQLHPGETLLVYTDGLECAFPSRDATRFELRKASKRYLDHLTRLAASNPTLSLTTMMNELTALLDEQAGSLHQADDVTALAIAMAESDGIAARQLAA